MLHGNAQEEMEESMKVMYLKGVGAVGDHILRRVDRQYKTEADDILQDHRHTDDV